MSHSSRAFQVICAVIAVLVFLAVSLRTRSSKAEPLCQAALDHAAESWQRGTCADLRKQELALNQLSTECKQTQRYKTQSSLLRARLLGEPCQCENAERAIATARARNVSALSCEQVLEGLGTLRSSLGICQRESVLLAYRGTEKSLLEKRGSNCADTCGRVVDQVRHDGCGVSTNWVKCLGCAEAERKQCSEIQSQCRPGPNFADAPARQLLNELQAALLALNQSIRGDPRCAKASGCLDLEMERLRVLTSYLTLLKEIPLSEKSRVEQQQSALQMLRVMGLEADLVKVLLSHSPDELRAMADLAAVANNQELRDYLIDQLTPLREQGFQPILEALREGASIERLLRSAQQMTPTQRASLYRIAGAVGFQEAGVRHDFLEQILKSRFDVLLPPLARENNCANCGEFWGRLRKELDGAEHPNWIDAVHPSQELSSRLQQRVAVCGGKEQSADLPGCGPVLALEATQESDGTVLVTPYLRYVRRSEQGASVSQLPLNSRRLAKVADKRTQGGEALALASAVIYQFNRLLETPVSLAPTVEVPSAVCGVRVIEDVRPKKPAPRTAKLRLMRAECRTPAFRDALLVGLQRFGLERRLDLDVLRSGAPAVATSDADGSPPKPFKCELDLMVPDSQGRLTPEYSIAASVIDVAECPGDFDSKWHNAAERVAWQLATYLSSVEVVRAPAVESVARSKPPYLHALLFSGARQLEYSQGKRGWGWAVSETALWVLGTSLAAIAVSSRNRANQNGSDAGRANAYLDSAYGAFLMVIPLRLLSGAFCCSDRP